MSLATPTRPVQPVDAPPDAPTPPPEPRIQPGDIILYPAQPSDWTDALIASATSNGNPDACYVHCGVVEQVEVSPGDGALQITTIEALTRGVSRVTFPLYADVTPERVPTFARIAGDMEPLRIAHGLAWLSRQVGARYGWADIAADALKALLPHTLGARTPFLIAPSAFDCSDLCTRYLLTAGYEWLPDEAIAAPERQSPNDLARLLNVLKG
jgi:hypothetical protein